MPLDEVGAKWSCEPCIRGHRSSKCQHFDRIMMKVPKAGRPLAKCPHPKGSCSCQKTYAFMIRIPKGSTCLCRPVCTYGPDGKETRLVYDEDGQLTFPTPPPPPGPDAPIPIASPASNAPVTSPAPGTGGVQMSGGQQSNIQRAPENIEGPFGSISGPDGSRMNNGMSPAFAPHTPSFGGTYSQLPPGFNGYMTQQPFDAGKQSPEPAQSNGSCCASKTRGPPFFVAPFDDDYSEYSGPQISSGQNYNAGANSMQSFAMHQPQAHRPYIPVNPANMSNASPAASMSYPTQGIPHSTGYNQPPVPAFYGNNGNNLSFTPPPYGDPNHECSCGDGCQCLGCAQHPFNTTTKQHVQEMGILMTLDEDQPDRMNGHHSPPFGNTNGTPLYSLPNFGNHSNAMHAYPDQTPYHSNGYSSPTDYSQQLMEPSEYYTLEYPVGLPNSCSDVSGSCQCGNDCSCVGCLTHSGHNGVPLEPMQPMEPPTSASGSSPPNPSPSMLTEVEQSRIPVLDNLSVPSMSPQAIEP